MPTISSMLLKNDMLANVSHRYFKLDVDAADKSVLVGAVIRTSADLPKSDFGGQPALTTMVENYSADKEDFRSKFQDNLDSLQESSDKLKDSVKEDDEKVSSSSAKSADSVSSEETKVDSNLSTLANFAKDNVPPRAKILEFPQLRQREDDSDEKIEEIIERAREAREEDVTSAKTVPRDRFKEFAENYLVREDTEQVNSTDQPATSEENLLERVQNFVRNYNSVVSQLNENRGMSNRISALAANFSTNEGLQSALGRIGISVNAFGELTVDSARLLGALENNSGTVTSLLGSEGLTGMLDRNLNLANYQGDNLFPTIDEYAGEETFESWEYLYSARTTNTAHYAQDRPKTLLNAFT